MAIVDAQEVADFLSSPPWSEAQWRSVERIIEGRQSALESRLGVPIEPVERLERATILKSGLLATTAPVYAVHEIEDVAAPADGLPPGYQRRDRYWVATEKPPTAIGSTGLGGLSGLGYGAVLIRYDAGWGPHPHLHSAILEKSADIARNRHDNTVTTSGLDAEALPAAKEDWTDEELVALHRFKLARMH